MNRIIHLKNDIPISIEEAACKDRGHLGTTGLVLKAVNELLAKRDIDLQFDVRLDFVTDQMFINHSEPKE